MVERVQLKEELPKKRGRPSTYKPEYDAKARALCKLGATDQMLAVAFNMTPMGLRKWRELHPEWHQAMREGKLDADTEVAEALFKRAIGYSYISREPLVLKTTTITKAKTVVREQVEWIEKEVHVPPNVTACIYWLKCRQKEEWGEQRRQVMEIIAQQSESLSWEGSAVLEEMKRRNIPVLEGEVVVAGVVKE